MSDTVYGIARRNDIVRANYTREQALDFLAEAMVDGISPGVYNVVYRTVPEWQRYEEYTADELLDHMNHIRQRDKDRRS